MGQAIALFIVVFGFMELLAGIVCIIRILTEKAYGLIYSIRDRKIRKKAERKSYEI